MYSIKFINLMKVTDKIAMAGEFVTLLSILVFPDLLIVYFVYTFIYNL